MTFRAWLDLQPVSRLQVMVCVLCFLVVALDGFDTAVAGFLAPAIADEWNIAPSSLAPLFGAGLFGLMTGAFVFGPIADRLGRKPVLLITTALFGVFALLSSQATSFQVLVVLRFLTGLGLGGAMPSALTLTSEFCPERRRSLLVTAMFCGFTIGSALGGFISAAMVPTYGWRSVLVFGGLAPLLMLPLLHWFLPESVSFRLSKNSNSPTIPDTMMRITQDSRALRVTIIAEETVSGTPVSQLFKARAAPMTALLWAAYFASLLVVYLLTSWMPLLLKQNGYSLDQASLVTAMFQVGGTAGAIVLGLLMDRRKPASVLGWSYAMAALSIIVLSVTAGIPVINAICVFIVGLFLSGGQVGLNAFTASLYPTAARATGVSWANGVGRIGSITGSLAGGVMIAMGWPMALILASLAIVAGTAGIFIFALGRFRQI